MKVENILICVVAYFAFVGILEWLFGKFFYDTGSLFFLLAGGKFFKAIFLVLFIYFASLLAAISARIGTSSTNAGNVTLILIGAILFLSGANDIYDLYQAKDFNDFGEQTFLDSSHYIYKVDSEAIYSPERIVARAKSRLYEHDYSVFGNNCEQFARWCRNGD